MQGQCSKHKLSQRLQRGAAAVEFVIIAPLITALGLGILQYGMLFFAKGQINHASFMAGRAGAVNHAMMDPIKEAYRRALIPLYGGGTNAADLIASYAKAVADTTDATLRIELLNPTKESFDDFAIDKNLSQQVASRLNLPEDTRAIPNSGLALRPDLTTVMNRSGQTIQDANLLKLRITHGYLPKVWLMGMIYTKYLQWLNTGNDPFTTQLINAGRIPVVSHITLEMHSEAVDKDNSGALPYASNPGIGNGGSPINPGDPPISNKNPPQCFTIGCTVIGDPPNNGGSTTDPGNGGSGGTTCTGSNCSVCDGST